MMAEGVSGMIGLCSVTLRESSPEEVIDIAKDAGLEVIEWGSDTHVPENDLENAEKVAKKMKEAGLTTSSYGTYYQAGSNEAFEPFIETAERLDTKMLRVWAGDKGSEEADDEWFQQVVEDAKRIARLAREKSMSISFEYYKKTLTDTPESAHKLMEAIDEKNVFLYWQPAESLTVEERKSSLSLLGEWVTNVHVFHWEDDHNRYELKEGADEWREYISRLLTYSPYTHHFLLEFVKDDSPEQLKKDAETLKKIIETTL